MNPSDWITVGQIIASLILGTASIVWVSAWWLSKQFSATRTLIYDKIDTLEANIVAKLEYHERNDDDRFKEIRNDITDIRVRNAARDGYTTLIKKNDLPTRV